MTKINEDIERNRVFWRKYPEGYIGHTITEKYSDAYGGFLHLVAEQLIKPYLRPDSIVLEIGSGNGRWTQFLAKAKEVFCVEIMDLEKILRERFPNMNLKIFILKDDIKLDFLKDGQIDYIFSFDTFVHLGQECIKAYFEEFYRVLKFGGYGIIHYSDWQKFEMFKGKKPDENAWPKNGRIPMEFYVKNSGLTLITSDTKILSRDRILIFTKEPDWVKKWK